MKVIDIVYNIQRNINYAVSVLVGFLQSRLNNISVYFASEMKVFKIQ